MIRKIIQKIYLVKLFRRIIPTTLKIIIKILKKNRITIAHKKILIQLNLNNPIDREIYFKGEYEKKQLDYISKNIKKENMDYFIDVGAHMGFYSINLAKEKINIISFEPIKENFIQLKKNIQINNMKNIKIFNFGLSNNNKKVLMWVPNKEKTGGYSIFDTKDEEIKKYNFKKIHKKLCRIKKGDDLIKLKNKKIAIKIDVERHEINVLKGIEELIKKNQIFLQIELFDKRKKNITNYLQSKKFVFLKKIKKDYFFKNF